MADEVAIKGSCLCERGKYQISIRTEKLPLKTTICHCNRCRHTSGVLCTTLAELPVGCSPQNDTLKSLRLYNSSEKLQRYFCPTCGSHMFILDGPSQRWRVATGTLKQADGIVEIKAHTFLEDTVDGGLSDWLPRSAGRPVPRYARGIDDEQLPEKWAKTTQTPKHKADARIRGHCGCGGVNIYLARPSSSSAEAKGPYPDVLLPYYIQDRPPETETWWLRANGMKFLAGVCTCDSCRLATGYEFQQWAFVPTADISLSADGTEPFRRRFGTLDSYRSSEDVTRHFCKVCGATVFWDGDVRPDLIDVSVGLLDAPEGSRANSLLDYCTERVSYREFSIERARELTLALEAGFKAWNEEH